ncbi:MAG: PHP domain-containing protein [Acidobacteria bacterium]|nr:MAG: PHP domain-containing protein [Acidobacteriota bacterium]
MLVDLHVHTVFSGDAVMAPEELIARAEAMELGGIAVTEHDSYAASEATAALAEGSDLIVFRGIEVATDMGHLLVFGLEDDDWRTLQNPVTGVVPARSLVPYVLDRAGVVIAAHPFKSTSPSLGERVLSLSGVNIVEGFNGRCFSDENVRACQLAQAHGLRIVGGSGAHLVSEVGRCVTEFEERIETLSELVAALKAGRFRGRYYGRLAEW